MDRVKNCLACGNEMQVEADRCECCGFEGQNRLFLSRQEYEAWENSVLVPYMDRIKPVELFAGPKHILMLRGNGDLYAIGDNYSGACGADLPEVLQEPTLIASNVRHAAAGETHTIYVTNEGEVKVIGNSDFAERFDCAISARKVYAHYQHLCFLIEDEEGNLYFAGDREKGDMIPPEWKVLRTLDSVKTKAYHTTKVGNGYNYRTGTHTYSVGFSRDPESFEEIMSYKRTDEFREFVKTYGEENVQIRLGAEVRKTKTGTREHHGYEYNETETEYELMYAPTVRLYNNIIYQPEPVDLTEENLDWYHGSWKMEVEKYWAVPENADVVRCGCIYSYVDNMRGYIRIAGYIADGAFGIVSQSDSRYTDELEILPPTAGFINFAFTESRENGNLILLVKENGEMLLGNIDEMFGSVGRLEPVKF